MVTLQLPRAHLFLLLAVLTVLLGVGVGIAQSPSVNLTLPWHVLQQVAKGPADMTSVDASGNNIIDEADNAGTVGGINPSDFCRLGDTRAGCASGGTGPSTGVVQGVQLVTCTSRSAGPNCPCSQLGPGWAPAGPSIRYDSQCQTTQCTFYYFRLCAKQ